jgi:hypothetical protein
MTISKQDVSAVAHVDECAAEQSGCNTTSRTFACAVGKLVKLPRRDALENVGIVVNEDAGRRTGESKNARTPADVKRRVLPRKSYQ